MIQTSIYMCFFNIHIGHCNVNV